MTGASKDQVSLDLHVFSATRLNCDSLTTHLINHINHLKAAIPHSDQIAVEMMTIHLDQIKKICACPKDAKPLLPATFVLAPAKRKLIHACWKTALRRRHAREYEDEASGVVKIIVGF